MIDFDAVAEQNTQLEMIDDWSSDILRKIEKLGSSSSTSKNKDQVSSAIEELVRHRKLLRDIRENEYTPRSVRAFVDSELYSRVTLNRGDNKSLFIKDLLHVLDRMEPPICDLALFRGLSEHGRKCEFRGAVRSVFASIEMAQNEIIGIGMRLEEISSKLCSGNFQIVKG